MVALLGGASETYRLVISVGGTLYGEYGSGRAITTTASGKISAYIYVGTGTTINLTYYPMLVSGNTQKTYEPYVGGAASPNPSYPQNIEVVTGTQEVKVENVNLLKLQTLTEKTINGITFTPHYENGLLQYINVNGTATSTATYNLQGGNVDSASTFPCAIKQGSYRLSGYPDSTNNYKAIYLRYTYDNSTFQTISATSGTNLNATQDCKIASYIRIQSGYTANNEKVYPQLEKGSTSTTYTPHQEQTQIVELSSKNLFGDTLRQGVTNYETGGYSSNNAKRITTTNWITLPKGTYTISAKTNQNITLAISNVTFDINGNFYDISGVSGQWKDLPYTITLPQDTKWKCNLSYSIGQDIFPSEISEMQIEVGSQKTTYEEYYNYELCKIGNYQDYLYKSGDKWYKKEYIGKTNIDTTQITLVDTYSNIDYAGILKATNFLGYNTYDEIEIKCNKATFIPYSRPSWNTSDNVGKISGNANLIRWWLGFTKGTTLDNMKNALLNSYIYYPLQNANDIQITNETLIEQLNNLGKMYSYNGITNISSNGNLPIVLGVSALKGES